MLSVENPYPGCWFMLDRRGTSYECYGASLFHAGKQSQVVIFDLRAGNDASGLTGHLEISQEIYSTVFWAEDSNAVGEEIVNNFVQCRNYFYPIELVYGYGGQIHGETPLFAPLQGLN